MTQQDGDNRCKYCWRPYDYKRRHGEGFHNEGCPEGSGTQELREWEAGWAYGFADNKLPYWKQGRYSKAFMLGHRVGKAEIDALVEEAVQARNNYGEHL